MGGSSYYCAMLHLIRLQGESGGLRVALHTRTELEMEFTERVLSASLRFVS